MQLNVQISEENEYFLKRLAAQQFNGSILNYLSTAPIHVVQHAEPVYNEIEFIDDADYLRTENEDCEPLSVDNFVRNELCIPYNAMSGVIEEINSNRILAGEPIYIPFNEQEECVTDYLQLYGIATDNVRGFISSVGNWEPTAYTFTRASAVQLISELQRNNPGMYRAFADSCSESGNCNDFPPLYNLLVAQGQQLLDDDWEAFEYTLIKEPNTDVDSLEHRVENGEALPIHIGTLVVNIPEDKATGELLAGRYELDVSAVKEEESDYSYPFATDVTLSFPKNIENEMNFEEYGLASIQYPFAGENKYNCLTSEDGWKRIFDFARFMA